MQFAQMGKGRQGDLADLFRSTFAASEGEQEGERIGQLASGLSQAIDGDDVLCFGAFEGQALAGAIFFTRLRFSDDVLVYMLAPVAVSAAHQAVGVGSALIRFGIDALTRKGAAVAVTYGDPAFYGRLGFEPLPEDVLMAPMPLSMPFGWLGQSLDGRPIQARNDRPVCVEPFRSPAYW